MLIERSCRITKVDEPVHPRASHLKPWRDATNEERLDGKNGLLLTPSIDHLLDKGFISFENSGELIVSPVPTSPRWSKWALPRTGSSTSVRLRKARSISWSITETRCCCKPSEPSPIGVPALLPSFNHSVV